MRGASSHFKPRREKLPVFTDETLQAVDDGNWYSTGASPRIKPWQILEILGVGVDMPGGPFVVG
jgi:hypothetical protein